MARLLGRRARIAAAGLLATACLSIVLSTASATAASRVYFHGSRTEHVVALTFDDGWTPSNCARVDRILRAQGVAATFFPSARWVERAPSLWKALATRYPFGDHTSSHPHMKGLSYARQYDEIASDKRIVERITGVPLIRVFRAPYGEFDTTTLEAAAAAGFPVTMEWDVNVYDLTGKSDAELLAQATSGRNGSVITMHCGADATVRILPKVIDAYRARGFGFVTVPDLLAGHIPAPATQAGSAARSTSPSTSPPTSPEPTTGPAAAAANSGPAAPRPSTRMNAAALRSLHLLLVLGLAAVAVLLWASIVRLGRGGPGRAQRGFRGPLRA
jgi:peptidoglycan/xylan/chitin deacetylase (PgdA/CDA1 family)